jgi:antitoxin component YwqK of YwqJK toxin-antitoxin module
MDLMKKDIVNRNDNWELHGIQIGYYDNGNIKSKKNFVNGLQHGEQLMYYSNGDISFKYKYINGKKHGIQIGYHGNGQIRYKDNYINGNAASPEEFLAYERKVKLTIIKDL